MLKRRGKFAPSVGAVSRLQKPIVETSTNESACSNVTNSASTQNPIDLPEPQSDPPVDNSTDTGGFVPPTNDEPSLQPLESPILPLSLETPLQHTNSTLDKENLVEHAPREKNWDTQSKDASVTSLEEQHLGGPSISHYKARKKVCPVIREGSHRNRTFSSTSESEDDAGRRRARTPLSPVKKAATVSTPSKSKDCGEISVSGGEKTDPKTKRKKKKAEKTQLELKKEAMRRKFAAGEVDRKDWTMFDLIYLNPKDAEEPARPKEKLQMRLKPYEVEELAKFNQLDGMEEVTNNILLDERLAEEEEMRRGEEAPSEPKDALDFPPSNEGEHIEQEENAMPAPQLRLAPDGVTLIVDERSLVIDTTEATKNKNQLANAPVVIENNPTLVNYGSWNKRKRSARWSKEETARFHLALRMVGTDFSLMETIFRHRKRTELKRKFKSEEKCNPELIEKAISNQIPFNLEQLREEVVSSGTESSNVDTRNVASKKATKAAKAPRKRKATKCTMNDGEAGNQDTTETTDSAKPGSKRGRRTPKKKSKGKPDENPTTADENPTMVEENPIMGPPKKKPRTKSKTTKAETTNTTLLSDASETSTDENPTLSAKAKKMSSRKRAASTTQRKRPRKSKIVEADPVAGTSQSLSEDSDRLVVDESVKTPENFENVCTPLNSLLQSPLGQLSLEQGGITVVENPASEKQAPSFLVPPALAEANPVFAQAQPGSLVLVSSPNPVDPENQMVHVYRISMPLEPVPT